MTRPRIPALSPPQRSKPAGTRQRAPASRSRSAPLVALAAVLLLSAPLGGLTDAEPNTALEVTNRTGGSIEMLFVRPAGSTLYAFDTLSLVGPIEPEGQMTVGVHQSFNRSAVDLLAVDNDGLVHEIPTVTTTSGSTTEVILSEQTAQADVRAPTISEIAVTTPSSADTYYVYADRSDTPERGANLLSGATVYEGETVTLRVLADDLTFVSAVEAVDSFGTVHRIELEDE